MPSSTRISLFGLSLVLAVISTAGWAVSGFQAGSANVQTPQERPSLTNRVGTRSRTMLPPLRATPSGVASNDDSSVVDPFKAPLPSQGKKERRILLVWLHAVSIFVVYNYVGEKMFPGFLLLIPLDVWNLIHALSAMLFAGGVITTTLLEWNLPAILGEARNPKKEQRQRNNDQFAAMLLPWLWQVESRLVLPSVTASLISGVAQSYHSYGTLRFAPVHVKSALHVMFLFGIWWGWTDRRSQASLREHGFDESKVVQRRLSNIVSCAFLVALYSIMILKPGL